MLEKKYDIKVHKTEGGITVVDTAWALEVSAGDVPDRIGKLLWFKEKNPSVWGGDVTITESPEDRKERLPRVGDRIQAIDPRQSIIYGRIGKVVQTSSRAGILPIAHFEKDDIWDHAGDWPVMAWKVIGHDDPVEPPDGCGV